MTTKNTQVKKVSNFSDLVKFQFSGKNNAVCWERNLKGNFEELVLKLQLKEDITEVTPNDLLALKLSEEGIRARDIILEDLRLLSEFGAQPTLNLLKCYEKDNILDFISTDVYSFHVDRSALLIDTYLCTYFGASSDIIANEDVTQKIMIPEIRAQLRELHDTTDGDFERFVEEHFFDLHYQAHEGADVTNLGVGNLWRLAVDHPDQPVLPCVHRAPIENKNELRLMVIC